MKFRVGDRIIDDRGRMGVIVEINRLHLMYQKDPYPLRVQWDKAEAFGWYRETEVKILPKEANDILKGMLK